MTIDFDIHKEKIFNKLYYNLMESKSRIVVNYGGAGSGKSYSTAQQKVIKCLENSNERILVIRKVANTLKDSVVSICCDILNTWELQSFYTLTTHPLIIKFKSGASMIFKGLDDPEKIKSIQGITDIWIEEASELEEADFDQLNLRLRGKDGLQITLTLNPIDESHFIKKRFFDNGIEADIIKTTYLDNKFINSDYKNVLEGLKQTDYNYYRIYCLGEWGKIDSGAEFYKKFNPVINVKRISYNSELPLHISFDENVNPYLTCIISQCIGNTINIIDEICFKPPKNNIDHVCTELKTRYFNHNSGMFIYGDATSLKSDTKIESGHNFYSLIARLLDNYRPELRIKGRNPSPFMRGMFINDIFSMSYQDLRININEFCKNTIEDFKYVKQASDGNKLKEKIKDPKTGVTYEKYGHCSDATDYLICQYFSGEYIEYQNRFKVLKPGGVGSVSRFQKITL